MYIPFLNKYQSKGVPMLRYILFLSYFFASYGSLFSMDMAQYDAFREKMYPFSIYSEGKKFKKNNSGPIGESFLFISTITENSMRNTTKSYSSLIGEKSVISNDIGKAIKEKLLDLTAHERDLWEDSKKFDQFPEPHFRVNIFLSLFDFMNLSKKNKAIVYGIRFCDDIWISGNEKGHVIFNTKKSYNYFSQLPLLIRAGIRHYNYLNKFAYVNNGSYFRHKSDARVFTGMVSGMAAASPIVAKIVQSNEAPGDKIVLSAMIVCVGGFIGTLVGEMYDRQHPIPQHIRHGYDLHPLFVENDILLSQGKKGGTQ